jgi:cytochrome c biogenesis protein CcdA/thiol-disulfide isomerase/thioredoxin
MLLLMLAYFGGILTILSPCILPVLPFVFSRADRPFRKSGLPLLAGMVVTFVVVASLATVGGGWAVRANQYGRIAALILFAVFGVALLSSSLAERFSRPLVRLGSRLSENSSADPGIAGSFLLGIGTGLLWAPCAGPILGLILTGAALSGANAHTALLLFFYACGAATSLTVALLAGGRAFATMKRSLGAEVWIRRVLGAAVLASVVVVAFGLDRGVLARLSLAGTTGLEQRLVDRFHPQSGRAPVIDDQAITANHQMMASNQHKTPVTDDITGSSVGDPPPDPGTALKKLSGATAWINSPPLTPASLRGKVVLVDFWTYSCINCLRTLPYVKPWYSKYRDSGLVIIGVHTPEFPFEKDEANVRKAIHDLGIVYPVAMDNDYRIWRNFNNEYWPADYFIDATGHIRYHHFGEGSYEESEQWIRSLLKEAKQESLPNSATTIAASGIEAAPDLEDVESPETYIGYDRAQNFASPGGLSQDVPHLYQTPDDLQLNQWALAGEWNDTGQIATLLSPTGSIEFRFHARDLHLVLGPARGGNPVHFRVTIDGKAPGQDHGVDADSDGYGTVTGYRLYQLVRQRGGIQDRTFRIEFLSPGVQAYSFTFG